MKNFRILAHPSVDAASMERRWSVDGGSMEDQTSYFARIAAVLLMLLTMSVGQVWG